MSRHIQCERLVLRELEPSDYSAEYRAWLNNPDVIRYLETRHQRQDETSIRAFIRSVRERENEFLFGIFLRGGGRHIGNIKVGPIHPYHCVADVSLLIGARNCWGRGFAAEAIAGLSRYAFEVLGVEKLSASMYAPNVGSARAFLKVGYQAEGLRRAHYQLDDGRCDLIELGLLPGDVEDRQ